MTKLIAPAANPLRLEENAGIEKVSYVGYTMTSSLEILTDIGEGDPMTGLWSLVQLPHGGDLVAATSSRAEPQAYFGEVPKEDLVIKDRFLCYRMRAAGEQKIGLPAAVSNGRVGYLYGKGDDCRLVIRNFTVNPSGEYIDPPWKTPDVIGFSTQACNINNSALGAFSELEHHAPAIGGRTGRKKSEETSQIWAFRGKEEEILKVMRLLVASDY